MPPQLPSASCRSTTHCAIAAHRFVAVLAACEPFVELQQLFGVEQPVAAPFDALHFVFGSGRDDFADVDAKLANGLL